MECGAASYWIGASSFAISKGMCFFHSLEIKASTPWSSISRSAIVCSTDDFGWGNSPSAGAEAVFAAKGDRDSTCLTELRTPITTESFSTSVFYFANSPSPGVITGNPLTTRGQ